MSSVTITHTANDVASYVKRQFGDESGVQVTDQDIIRWINMGQTEIFRRNKPIKKTGTADLVAGQYKYTFPTDVMQVEKLRVKGITIEQLSFQEAEEYINRVDPVTASTALPKVWYDYGGSFMFYPIPDTSSVGGIELFYVPEPTSISVITSQLSVPDAYYNRLLEYVMAQAHELDENFTASQVKSTQFQSGLDIQNLEDDNIRNTYPRVTVLWEDM